jgi:ketosteroid isomerase-like protein
VLPDGIEVTGDLAVDRHRWVLDSMPKRGGRPVHDEGKGVWFWRRQTDGNWKIARSIWNSDLPRASFRPGSGAELSEDLAAINRLLDDFVGAVNAGDPEAWGELMTEEFIFAVPDLPQFVGKRAAVCGSKGLAFSIRSFFGSRPNMRTFRFSAPMPSHMRASFSTGHPKPAAKASRSLESARAFSASRATAGNMRTSSSAMISRPHEAPVTS